MTVKKSRNPLRMAEATAMAVDTPATLAFTDCSYLDSLEEPWKSVCVKALPTEGSSDAVARLEQLELDVRSQFLQLFFETTDSTQLVEKAGAFWTTTLNVCLHMIHHATHAGDDSHRYHKMTPRRLPILLLEDGLDAMSVDDAKTFWGRYVEPSLDRPPHLLGDLLWKSSNAGHLPFLRVCNQFLRLLDTAAYGDQGEWKGRILTALAKGFSIADRSALKYWGSFHDSVTEYDTEETFDNAKAATGSQGSAVSKTAVSKMDYSLYESFWSLQSDFSNPNRIQVASFIKKMKLVLEAMESAASSRKSQSTASSVPACTSFRYMTSSSLLPTQLATPDFRSSVVSQFLITASHLSSESASLANALAPLLLRAKKMLQGDAPELYHLLCESILAHREDAWRKWKKDKCPVSAFDPKQKPKAKNGASPTKARSRLLMAGALGSMDQDNEKATAAAKYESLPLDELVKDSKELKQTVPTLQDHLERYVEALDPESGIEAEYHPGNDSLFAWRAMRLFAKHQLPLLKHCRRPADLERITREWYIQQGKQIPGDMPPAAIDEDLDEEDDAEDGDKASEVPNEDEENDGDEDLMKEDQQGSDKEANEDRSIHSDDVVMKERTENQTVGATDDEKSGVGSAGGASVKGEDEDLDRAGGVQLGDTDDENLDLPHSDDEDEDGAAGKRDTQEIIDESAGNVNQEADNDADREAEDTAESASKNDEPVDDMDGKDGDENEGKAIYTAIGRVDDAESAKEADKSNAGDEADETKKGEGRRRRDSSGKRKRSRSDDRNKAPWGSSRGDGDRRDRPRSGNGNRGGGRRDDGLPRGRHDTGPDLARGGWRDGGPTPGGGRGGGGGAPPRSDGGAPNRGGSGKHDDGPPPPRIGRNDGMSPPRRDGGPPRGGGGGGRGGDRRDERPREGAGDRRRGRADSRFRGRR